MKKLHLFFVKYFSNLLIISVLLLIAGANPTPTAFELLSPKKTGIAFQNKLTEDRQHNILRYEYFYNGGGVAVGDLNNDGLEDLFFTGNMTDNRLYLNKGNFQFEDITKSAGVKGKNAWTTGAAMADVNADGLLDIYVCYSGNGDEASRRNELYINQGNLTFREEAAKFGLADASNSTQALFFDYDRDGDLDIFLLNHHIQVINEIEFDQARATRHPWAGDKLYRNDGGQFTDVSEAAGIKGSAMGFGLGVSAADLNGDQWPDLYVSNDYIEQDYLYINNGDGTFSDQLAQRLQHLSHFSMGLDVADMNNDGLMDIFTLDMLPEDNERQKLLYGPENYEQYSLMVSKGFHFQHMRNMLHINQGNGLFSEIGQLAGVGSTDWSWSALFFDANNNGHKDLFVSNGYYRDYTNRDFLKYKSDYYFKAAVAREPADTFQLVTSMTSTPISNYVFENQGNLRFTDQTQAWGLHLPGFSSGAVYADFDNDGQLDLVVNNINAPASVYRNRFAEYTGKPANYLQFRLKGQAPNTTAIGATVVVYAQGQMQVVQQQPVRGFQSSMSHRLHVGMGTASRADSVVVTWPSGQRSVLKQVLVNQVVEISESTAKPAPAPPTPSPALFAPSPAQVPYQHREYGFNDFKRQPMLTEMPSYVGPCLASADLNADGAPEVFVGGTKGNPAKIYTYQQGQWAPYSGFFSPGKEFTDASALFFDANADGHPDLYVASGGYHDYQPQDAALQDRLYINDGEGHLTIRPEALPPLAVSSSKVLSADFNADGHPDLFVGGRIVPGRYPMIPNSYLLLNNGQGSFTNATNSYLPAAGRLGMVTDAISTDLNADGLPDLVVAGEFMAVEVFINQGGKKLANQTAAWFERPLRGWWKSLAVADFDRDGDMDLLAGNFGLNSAFKPSPQEPLTLYAADFDGNSSLDPLLVCYIQHKPYPFASRDELLDQIYPLRSKFTNYASYSRATIADVVPPEQLATAFKLEADEFESVYLENAGGKFVRHALPIEAQFAPISALLPLDANQDGHLDFVAVGNQSYIRIRLGVIDANNGQLFQGDGRGHFQTVPPTRSGFSLIGDVKSALALPGQPVQLLFGVNNVGVRGYVVVPNNK